MRGSIWLVRGRAGWVSCWYLRLTLTSVPREGQPSDRCFGTVTSIRANTFPCFSQAAGQATGAFYEKSLPSIAPKKLDGSRHTRVKCATR